MATIDLAKYGITGVEEVVYNPSYETLFEEETKLRIINYFWIVLTVVIAICTIYVSILTIRNTIRTRSQIRELDRQIEFYEEKIESDSIFIKNITQDPEFMESYAREQYHMQRPGETVYILEE